MELYTSLENIHEFLQPLNLKIIIKDENSENYIDLKEMKEMESNKERKKSAEEREKSAEEREKSSEKERKKLEEKMYLKKRNNLQNNFYFLENRLKIHSRISRKELIKY